MRALGVHALAALLVAAQAAGIAGESPPTQIAFSAPVPCSFTCPHSAPSAIPEPDRECSPKPSSPPGSWDDVRIAVPAVAGTIVPALLQVVLAGYDLDFDLFVCRVHDPGTPSERWTTAARGDSNDIPGFARCSSGIPVGDPCGEQAVLRVAPGEVYELRAYNWLSTPDATGWYSYTGHPVSGSG